ncbi:zinc finger CCCH domain-containing protein 14 isoform X1 [Osmerus eperlanus]|uniref:zinc finger CCCH domain-containing protein 14 isoform X1 n=1 Tax=Osmerus eperlanus TaxID=29151 RepID=UPI002E15B346
MEIGTEISKKIRAAIKGKLQELGAYVDEELPDYIMVMVANKKTSQQMADDLSLFLGNNTIKFTVWLHGVLEKLRSVAVEPATSRPQLFDSGVPAAESHDLGSEVRKGEGSKALAVSSTRSDRAETRVSSSAHDHHARAAAAERMSSRLTSTVKPMMEPPSSEAVIDIKPELDDDLIATDVVEVGVPGGRTRGNSSRATAQVYRPPPGRSYSGRSADTYRSFEGSSHSRHQEGTLQDRRSNRTSRNGASSSRQQQEEASRKRKAPVASSVVRVSRAADEAQDSDDQDEEDDDDEEDEGYGARSMSSRVSLPRKPERRPSLPPAKQANKNLLLKAISEAQDSISKTTAYQTVHQKQTVPVAPRTRMVSNEMSAAIQLVQEHLHSLAPRPQTYTPTGLQPPRHAVQSRSLASRLQLDLPEENATTLPSDLVAEAAQEQESKALDTRSFIMSRPVLAEEPVSVRSRLGLLNKEEITPATPRMVQASKEKGSMLGSASPKFIVTLDGIPSPLGNLADCDMETDDGARVAKTAVAEAAIHLNREPKLSIHQRLQHGALFADEEEMEMGEDEAVPVKRQKVLERCKFWPVCKSADDCLYHHPTTQCKTFPNCKFGEKCLFVHPNCKYDAKCTKPDCPFTHVSRRGPAPPPRPVYTPAPQTQSASVCRFFPECKKVDCPFYHPKPCRFAAQCRRTGCTFYHPSTSVPPRHALKWTKTQSS